MATFVLYENKIIVPEWVEDLETFRRWLRSEEFPRIGQISFFHGQVWVDMTNCGQGYKSTLPNSRHDQVAINCNNVLVNTETDPPHDYYPGRCFFLTNKEASFCVQPDGMFASLDTIRRRILHHKGKVFLELEFVPDMILEVVSHSSAEKDTSILKNLYWQAGVQEYWLVDSREENQVFQICRRGARAYMPILKKNGWLKSAVFGKSFRLIQTKDELENPICSLEAR